MAYTKQNFQDGQILYASSLNKMDDELVRLGTDIVNIDVINNLNSTDATKPLSAAQGKVLNDTKVNKTDIINNLTSTNTDKPLSAAQGKVLNEGKVNISDIINNLTSTDTNKPLSAVQGKKLNDNKINISDIVNNLTSSDVNKPLSANQGKALNDNKVNISDIKDNLTSTDTNKPLSAKQGKLLDANKLSIFDTAAFHNSIVRGKDITSYYTDGTLWSRIAGTNGFRPYEDLYLGDYFKMSRAISAYEQTQQYQTTGSQYVTIAGFDCMRKNGDSDSMNFNHITCVPGQFRSGTFHFGRSRMNPTNTTVGGYVGSEMYTTTIGEVATEGSTEATATINQQLYAEFGSHLKTSKEFLSNAINASGYNRFGTNSGCSNNWAWYSCQAVLMSEIEVYGATVWSSSGFDTGTACMQLPLFAKDKACINNRSAYYWLKDVATASYFCYVNLYGCAGYYSAGIASFYVRPRFILA